MTPDKDPRKPFKARLNAHLRDNWDEDQTWELTIGDDTSGTTLIEVTVSGRDIASLIIGNTSHIAAEGKFWGAEHLGQRHETDRVHLRLTDEGRADLMRSDSDEWNATLDTLFAIQEPGLWADGFRPMRNSGSWNRHRWGKVNDPEDPGLAGTYEIIVGRYVDVE